MTRAEETDLAANSVLVWDADNRRAVGSNEYAKITYVNAISGLTPSINAAYTENIMLDVNTMTHIAELTENITITLSQGTVGFDNEWDFSITQGDTAYSVNLPAISWGLGIAPSFAANTTTICRLYYVGSKLCGEWVTA